MRQTSENSYTYTHCLYLLTTSLPFSPHQGQLWFFSPSEAALARAPSDQRVIKSSEYFSDSSPSTSWQYLTLLSTLSFSKHFLRVAWHLFLLVSLPSLWLLLPNLDGASLPLGIQLGPLKFPTCSPNCLSGSHGLSHHLYPDVLQICMSGSGLSLHTYRCPMALSISACPEWNSSLSTLASSLGSPITVHSWHLHAFNAHTRNMSHSPSLFPFPINYQVLLPKTLSRPSTSL